jgi:hypothetical protein
MTNSIPQDRKDCPWDDLVISILAVNQYSLERTYSLLQSLRDQKVTDPQVLVREGTDRIARRLRDAGCDRGPFMTNLFAERLAALGAFIRAHGIAECETIIGSRDAKRIKELLLPINGIGPVVLKNYFLLRGIQKHGL